MTESCLVTRLENFVSLTEGEKRFVAYLEREERQVSRGDTIMAIGSAQENLYVLKYGWAIVRSREERGRRAILRIYLPGEVIGLAELGLGTAIHTLEMRTDGAICPFPREAISEMYEAAPRLAALMTAISSLDQQELRERLFAFGRLRAEERLIQFFVALRDRLAITRIGANNRFHLPLTQSEIADYLGLTPVYVNKLLQKFAREGVIQTCDRHIRLLQREMLEERVGHQSLYASIDTSWFPRAHS